ncbi:MAG TPA: hypothetical protein VNW97_15105 [Candidatus Saccharimonadales bacterium]|jgi:hypothetical protein|nr:hypothetical protein [Candidatus Saccharimonadales bacterium]
MNNEKTAPGQEASLGQSDLLLKSIKKRIVPTEHSDPTVEPLFINFSHGAFLGDDFFLDVGVITLESIDYAQNPDRVGDFAVLTRLAMSKRTMIGIRDQINSLLTPGGTAKSVTSSD